MNPRFDLGKFTEQDFKYRKDLFPERVWYGCFDMDDSRCKSLSLLEKDTNGIILLAEIQSFVKGFGAPLIRRIISKAENLWFAVDPNGGMDLVEYYRQFGIFECKLEHSRWADGNRQYFFYKASDDQHADMILKFIGKANLDKTFENTVHMQMLDDGTVSIITF